MIQSLRHRHRLTIMMLTVLLPLIFVCGLLARKAAPVSARLPVIRLDQSPGQFVVIRDEPALWKDQSIKTRLLKPGNDATKVLLELTPLRDPGEPDVLVYVSEEKPADDRVADRALLLGSLNGAHPVRFVMPDKFAASTIHLILYSLAHHKVIATAELSPLPTRTNGGRL